MAGTTTTGQNKRQATLSLARGPEGQVLTARVPNDITDRDFADVAPHVLGLIRKLTGCNCLSGRIKVVIEDDFADVINVSLKGAGGGGPEG